MHTLGLNGSTDNFFAGLSFMYFFFISRVKFHVLLSYKRLGSDLKIAFISKVFGAKSYLMFTQQFDQVTYVCGEYNNFQDSKSIFMISDFKILSRMLLQQLNFGVCIVDSTSTFPLLQRKNSTFPESVVFFCCLVNKS